MLLNIDPKVSPDLLYCLARMGHGDELVIVDANYPARSTAQSCTHPSVISCLDQTAPEAVRLILGLIPLDGFYDYAARYMEIDGQPTELGEVHNEFLDVLNGKLPENGRVLGLERQSFYQRARRAFAVVQTGEARPFGCFILRKGVIF